MKQKFLSTLALAATLALAGCSSFSGHKSAADNSGNLNTLADKTETVRALLKDATATMDAIKTSATKTDLYATFKKQVADLGAQNQWFSKQSDAVAAQYHQLSQGWETRLAQIKDPAIHELLNAEKSKVIGGFSKLPEKIRAAGKSLDSVTGKLRDYQNVLSLSMSNEVLQKSESIRSTIDLESADCLNTLQDLIGQIRDVSQTLTNAAGTAAQPAPAK